MKRYTTILLLLIGVLLYSCGDDAAQKAAEAAAAQPKEPPAPDLPKRSLKLEEIGLQNPESVTSDGEFYYVSNLGPELKPFRKDQNGFIAKLDSAGKVVSSRWARGLDAPKGMVVVGGTLYVTDIDKIKAYDIESGRRVGTLDISKDYETPFLNDLEVKNDNEIFASLTNIGRILLVKLGEEMTYEEISVKNADASSPFKLPNGLEYDRENNLLYVVSYDEYGKMGVISWGEDGSATYTAGPDADFEGQLDGLALIRGKIVYSDWKTGALRMWNTFQEAGGFVGMQTALRGPADFYFDESRNELWIPAMQENRIYVMFFKY